MKRKLSLLFIAGSLAFSQSKAPVKPPVKAPVRRSTPSKPPEPITHSPGEVSCGRLNDPAPCECLRHRMALQKEMEKQCEVITDKHEKAICMVSANACLIDVRDAEHTQYDADGNSMPALCKRTCYKSKCTCCLT